MELSPNSYEKQFMDKLFHKKAKFPIVTMTLYRSTESSADIEICFIDHLESLSNCINICDRTTAWLKM